MIMYNLIKFLVLAVQALSVFSSMDELKYPSNCGWTPMYPMPLIVGGNIVHPDEFSWMASLEYGNKDSSGLCGGSVINSWYVLTAAHCVTGENVEVLGGLTGVRLGDFSRQPYCDYGSSTCTSFLHFGIAENIVHWNFHMDRNHTLHNDIALLRLDRKIPLNNILMPVCLPNVNISEPEVNTILTVSGWGKQWIENESAAKRAVGVPVISDPSVCEFQDEGKMCAGVLSHNVLNKKSMCSGDSGGPLMVQWKKRVMVLEGIISFVLGGNCANSFFPAQYTRVRHYLKWIDEHMVIEDDSAISTSVEDSKFPTDCGYVSSPNYGRNMEYSWLVTLKYKNLNSSEDCVGSVINSRYVLTSAFCVSLTTRRGPLTAVMVRDYNENTDTSTSSKNSRALYQVFGIEELIPHSGYALGSSVDNIALIRLNRTIQFGPKMKPICLPFGGNLIPQPAMHSNLVVTKRYRDANVVLSEPSRCRISTQASLCAIENNRFSRGPDGLLMYQFENQRMVLEGINSIRSTVSHYNRYSVFTDIRSYGDWLNQNMRM